MRRPGRRILALVVIAALTLAGCAGLKTRVLPAMDRAPPPPGVRALARRIGAEAAAFPGRVGVAVRAVNGGWSVAYDGDRLYPQQSVSKLCTALAVLSQVDAGTLRLTDPVEVGAADMSVFHQPIRDRLVAGRLRTTVDELLVDAIAQSDNAADDILIRLAGGAEAVQAKISSLHLTGVRCGPPEHLLESEVAGLQWRPDYSVGQAFWTAREALPMAVRRRALAAYLRDPEDGATPLALTTLLARLQRGELLSPTSTAYLLRVLQQTRTGPLRLPAGLPPGWSIGHKTGTGQDLGPLSTGNNDVGLLTAPDGATYAVVVMIASTRAPVPERQRLMADVARAVAAFDATRAAPPAPP